MIFRRSLQQELLQTAVSAFVVLFGIVIAQRVTYYIGIAASGRVGSDAINTLLGFSMLKFLPMLLSLTLFLAVLLTLTRQHRDSEMVIWHIGGRGLGSLLKPILRFAWPMLLAVFVLVLIVWPWTNQKVSDLKDRFERRGDLERVMPGQFQESANGLRVFFVDKESAENKEGKNVFIASNERGTQSMTSSKAGHIDISQEERFLILNTGQRVEQANTNNEIKISEFKVYGTRISKEVVTTDVTPAKATSTIKLIRNPTPNNLGELAWRLGLAIAAFNLLIIALAITSANHRVGRGGNLGLALFVFVVYYNFINIGQSWISVGKVEMLPFLMVFHGGVFVLAFIWLSVRHNNISWRQLFNSKPTNGETA